jgi:hypothetical protein
MTIGLMALGLGVRRENGAKEPPVYINASLLVFWKEKIGCRRWAWILGVGGFLSACRSQESAPGQVFGAGN